MASKMLNIEISEQIIKVCEIETGKKELKVLRSFMFATPKNMVRDGEILEVEPLANILGEKLKQQGINHKTAMISLVSGKVVVREVILPPIKETKLKQIIETNAGDYFPIDISKYHVTYSVLEKDMHGENPGYRILVYAVPLGIFAGYFRLAEILGLQVKDIDYNGNAVFRAYQGVNSDLVTMYVDIGYESSMVTVVNEKKFKLQRTFASGAEDILYSYMNATERPHEEFLTILDELSTEEGYQHLTEVLEKSDINDGFDRLISNVMRMINFFNSNNWQTPIGKIVILGVGGQFYGLEQLIATETELPVAHLDEISGIYDEKEGVIAKYLSCIACSLQPVGFVPSSYMKNKKKAKKQMESSKVPMLFFAGACMVTVILVVGSVGYHFVLQSKLNKMQEKMKSFQYVKDIANTSASYEKGIADLKKLADTIASPNEKLADLIKELEEKMPREINVMSAVCTKEGIDMNIAVSSKVAAASVIKHLRTFDSLKSVKVDGFTHESNENGIGQVTFSDIFCDMYIWRKSLYDR